MRRTRAVIVAALATTAALVVASCSTAEPSGGGASSSTAASSSGSVSAEDGTFTRPAVTSSGNVTMAVEEPPHDYNNNTGGANNFSNSQVTGLTQLGPFHTTNDLELLVDSDLMASVEQTSTSPQTVVYKINPKAVWSDGTKISCKDFYLAWLAANSKATSVGEDGQPAASFDPAGTVGYDQMQAPVCSDDGATVTTTYTTPYADWKSVFTAATLTLLPAHVVEKIAGVPDVTKITPDDTSEATSKLASAYSKDLAAFNKEYDLSSGPYVLDSMTDEQTVLVRNPKWWGNPAGPESITLVTNSNGQAQVQALQNQEVQVIAPQPDAALAEQLRSSANVEFNAYPGATYEHLDFNMGLPLFQGDDGKALREAMFYCVDRTDIIDKLVKQVNPDTKPLGNFQYLSSEADYVDHYAEYQTANIDKAKQIMEAAGWTLGSDGVYATAGGKRAEFRLGHKVIDTREKAVQLINGSCGKAGIKVNDDQDAEFHATRLPASDFDAALFAWVGNPFKSAATGNYSTGGGSNYNKYSNPQVDALYQQANVELDPDKRVQILNDMDELMAKDFASLPMYQHSDMVAQSTSITPTLTYLGVSGGALWDANEWVYQQ